VSCLSHSFRLDTEVFTVGRRRVHFPRRYLCIWPGNLTYQLCTPEAVRPRPRRRLFLAYLHALPQAAAPATARSSPGDISPHFRAFPLLVITCFGVRPHPRVCDVWRCGQSGSHQPAALSQSSHLAVTMIDFGVWSIFQRPPSKHEATRSCPGMHRVG
jgi:hypothetical protein